jgi:hypothetical protein
VGVITVAVLPACPAGALELGGSFVVAPDDGELDVAAGDAAGDISVRGIDPSGGGADPRPDARPVRLRKHRRARAVHVDVQQDALDRAVVSGLRCRRHLQCGPAESRGGERELGLFLDRYGGHGNCLSVNFEHKH